MWKQLPTRFSRVLEEMSRTEAAETGVDCCSLSCAPCDPAGVHVNLSNTSFSLPPSQAEPLRGSVCVCEILVVRTRVDLAQLMLLLTPGCDFLDRVVMLI